MINCFIILYYNYNMQSIPANKVVTPRSLSEFKPSRVKGSGNKEGGIFRDAQGDEWVIKSMDSLRCVHEAFAADLYRLFAGDRYIPETCLVQDEKGQLRVASKIRPGYASFDSQSDNVLYDEKHNSSFVYNKPVDGLELIVILSCLMRERDFYGNGNVGFILSGESTISGFRIDFDDSFVSDRTIGFENDSFMGALLDKLVADKMKTCFHLLSRENSLRAIERITNINDDALDKILKSYESVFKMAMQLKIQNLEQELIKSQEKNSETLVNHYKSAIAEAKSQEQSLQNVKAIITDIKDVKKKLAIKLHDYRAATPGLPATLPDGYLEVKKFFDIYDGYFTSLYPNFSSMSSVKLLEAIQTKGTEAPEYKNYMAMKAQVEAIFNNDKNQLQAAQGMLQHFQNKKERLIAGESTAWTLDNLNERIKDYEHTFKYYTTRVNGNKPLEEDLLIADGEIAMKLFALEIPTVSENKNALPNAVPTLMAAPPPPAAVAPIVTPPPLPVAEQKEATAVQTTTNQTNNLPGIRFFNPADKSKTPAAAPQPAGPPKQKL